MIYVTAACAARRWYKNNNNKENPRTGNTVTYVDFVCSRGTSSHMLWGCWVCVVCVYTTLVPVCEHPVTPLPSVPQQTNRIGGHRFWRVHNPINIWNKAAEVMTPRSHTDLTGFLFLFSRTVSCRSWGSWTTATSSVCGTSSTPVETRSVTSERCCYFEFICLTTSFQLEHMASKSRDMEDYVLC